MIIVTKNNRVNTFIIIGIILIMSLSLIIWNYNPSDIISPSEKNASEDLGGREVTVWPHQFNYLNPDDNAQDQAVALVNELQEVKEWRLWLIENDNPNIESRPIVEFDHMWDDIYVIHAFEWVKDGGNNAHAATLNWFKVDLVTKTITAEF